MTPNLSPIPKTVLALAFAALIGCSEEGEQKKPAAPATASTSAQTTAAPATASPAPALRIALAGPVTGTVAQYGDMQLIGARGTAQQYFRYTHWHARLR